MNVLNAEAHRIARNHLKSRLCALNLKCIIPLCDISRSYDGEDGKVRDCDAVSTQVDTNVWEKHAVFTFRPENGDIMRLRNVSVYLRSMHRVTT
jgi:hypothetical protein